MCMCIYIIYHIRRPLPGLGLGGAAPGITVGVRHWLRPHLWELSLPSFAAASARCQGLRDCCRLPKHPFYRVLKLLVGTFRPALKRGSAASVSPFEMGLSNLAHSPMTLRFPKNSQPSCSHEQRNAGFGHQVGLHGDRGDWEELGRLQEEDSRGTEGDLSGKHWKHSVGNIYKTYIFWCLCVCSVYIHIYVYISCIYHMRYSIHLWYIFIYIYVITIWDIIWIHMRYVCEVLWSVMLRGYSPNTVPTP